jgi:hypothetical protein
MKDERKMRKESAFVKSEVVKTRWVGWWVEDPRPPPALALKLSLFVDRTES